MPFLAIAIGLLIWGVRPHALPAALPVLCLWASSKLVALWLNESPLDSADDLPRQDALFLRNSALHTWRYFAEFCTEEHNWLIPDNVQQEPPAIAGRVSPTNLGFLLNARQVACEFGYLTVPELAHLTQRTLGTVSRLRKHNGHLLNWYDTRTLEPLPPWFVSSVDSGNLLASLWTLQQGCLDRLRRPLLDRSWAEGLLDYLRVLVDLRVLSRKQFSSYEFEPRERELAACRVGSSAGSPGRNALSSKVQECLRRSMVSRADPRKARKLTRTGTVPSSLVVAGIQPAAER